MAVGRVVDAYEIYGPDLERRIGKPIPVIGEPPQGISTSRPTPQPGLDRQPDPVGTVYVIELMKVAKGDLHAGDRIDVFHNGWIRNGISFQYDGDDPPQPGADYLFFLNYAPDADWYSAAPWGQFRIDGGGRVSYEQSAFRSLGAVRELEGRDLQAALDDIEQVAAAD